MGHSPSRRAIAPESDTYVSRADPSDKGVIVGLGLGYGAGLAASDRGEDRKIRTGPPLRADGSAAGASTGGT